MAESVDALVSNTSGATRAGSTPALGTRHKKSRNIVPAFLCFVLFYRNIDFVELAHVRQSMNEFCVVLT